MDDLGDRLSELLTSYNKELKEVSEYARKANEKMEKDLIVLLDCISKYAEELVPKGKDGISWHGLLLTRSGEWRFHASAMHQFWSHLYKPGDKREYLQHYLRPENYVWVAQNLQAGLEELMAKCTAKKEIEGIRKLASKTETQDNVLCKIVEDAYKKLHPCDSAAK